MSYKWSFLLGTKTIPLFPAIFMNKGNFSGGRGGVYIFYISEIKCLIHTYHEPSFGILPNTFIVNCSFHIHPVLIWWKGDVIMPLSQSPSVSPFFQMPLCSSARKRHLHPSLRNFPTKDYWKSLFYEISSHASCMYVLSIWSPGVGGIS